jgi:hypothetical protein
LGEKDWFSADLASRLEQLVRTGARYRLHDFEAPTGLWRRATAGENPVTKHDVAEAIPGTLGKMLLMRSTARLQSERSRSSGNGRHTLASKADHSVAGSDSSYASRDRVMRAEQKAMHNRRYSGNADHWCAAVRSFPVLERLPVRPIKRKSFTPAGEAQKQP